MRRFTMMAASAVLLGLLAFSTSFAVTPEDTPLLQKATDALMAGDIERATELYETYLSAVPDNAYAWYNLACARALAGNRDAALDALGYAVDTGNYNHRHASVDPDLESLRDDPRFDRIIQRMRTEMEGLSAAGQRRYYAEQKRYGAYDLYLPEGEGPFPVAVLLHGAGQNPSLWEELAGRLNAMGVAVIAPEAPYAARRMVNGYYYWYYRDMNQPTRELFRDAAPRAHADWLESVLHDAATRAPLDTDQAVLGGFSQGGSMTWWALAHNPAPWRGAVIFSSAMTPEVADPGMFARLATVERPNVLVLHGDRDDPGQAQRAMEVLEQAGVQGAELKMYGDTGHVISEAMTRDMLDWTRTVFGL